MPLYFVQLTIYLLKAHEQRQYTVSFRLRDDGVIEMAYANTLMLDEIMRK